MRKVKKVTIGWTTPMKTLITLFIKMKNLDEFLKLKKEKAKEIIGQEIKVERLFVRRDGFKDSDVLYYDKR